MPSRGSLTCISSIEATICLIRRDSLRARPVSAIALSYSLCWSGSWPKRSLEIVVVEHPATRDEHFDVRPSGDETFTPLEHLDHVLVGRRDGRDADLGPAVQVGMPGFRGRDREAPSQVGDNRPDDGALLLQRAHVAEPQIDHQGPDHHASRLLARAGCLAGPGRQSTLRSGTRLLTQLEGLDHVSDLDVVVGTQADTALEAFAHLGRVILEALQGIHTEVVGHDDAVANEPRLAMTSDGSRSDERTRHIAHAGHPEHLADLGGAELNLLELRLQHALQCGLDLVDGLVDNGVVPDVDALAHRRLASFPRRPDVVAEDHGIRRDGEVDVVLIDGTDAPADDAQRDLITVLSDVDLQQRVLERLHRAGHIALDDQVELLHLAGGESPVEVIQRDPPASRGQLCIALTGLAPVGDLPRDPVFVADQERVARAGYRGQAQDLA